MAGVLHHMDACTGLHDVGGVKERVHDPIKAIVGMEAYFRPDAKEHTNENKEYYHLVLLAKNLEGFRSLLKLTTESYDERNFYYKPCVDWEMLGRVHDGLIATSSCLSGYMPAMMLQQNPEEARKYVRRMKEIFGDDFFFEIQPHNFQEQQLINIEVVNMALEESTPFVATGDVHYPYHEWAPTHDVLVMINTGQSLASRAKKDEAGEDYMAFSGDTFYLSSDEELLAMFQEHHADLADYAKEAIENTQIVADRCEEYEISKHVKMPKAAESLMEAESIVRAWCEEGLERIGKSDDETYRARYEDELSILRAKRVLDYFVVIGDLVRWAKDQGIRVGAGRGSAAGSLVSYLTRITGIDPIGHGLLFERFINPTRAEPPDIDIDFQHNRRAEVKQHLADRWGQDHVADIAAFQRFGLRASLQNAARVFDVPYEEVMGVTKTFDDGTGEMNLEQMHDISPDLQSFAKKYPDVWEHATRLEGQVKAASKHAAGVVVTDRPIYEYMPTMRSASDGTIVTQWSERAEFPIITTYGFLKIDVLATDSLTIQEEAIRLIKERSGEEIDFEDPKQFPIVEDPYAGEQDVIEAFGHGQNLGVFQFESRGITGLLRDIQPTWFGDIGAANALFRPGPLEGGMAFDYAARKNGLKPIVYWHESVVPFLEETYGLMVYQEQIMQIVRALGDFTLAEADIVRKAMTKWQSTKIKTNKGRQEMELMREKFVKGCTEKGLPKQQADSIWEMILKFSIYGFNKSHSSGYGLQAYQDKWLKMRHPLEFYAALMTYENAKVPHIIREARARGIKILPPDINESGEGFTLDGNSIRFGLMAVKNVADAAIGEIMEHRPFTSYDDMQERTMKRKVNSRVMESLLNAGAFDCWGMRDDWSDEAKAQLEKQLLGFALAGKENISKYDAVIRSRCVDEAEFARLDPEETCMVAGEVTRVNEINTRRGERMAFVEISYQGVEFNLTFFPSVYPRYQHLLAEDNAIIVKGAKDEDRQCVKVDNCILLAELAAALKDKVAA